MFELCRHDEKARTWSQPVRSWSATRSLEGRRPAREPALELVREQDSVMEFGLNHAPPTLGAFIVTNQLVIVS